MNTNLLRILISIMTVLVAALIALADNSNIVIDSSTDTYRIYPDKSGTRMGKIKHISKTVYRALRAPDKAVAMMYYNDDISIDKTSGGDTSYGSYFSDDVFFSDSKACLMSLPLKEAGATATATMERTFKNPDLFCTVLLADYYNASDVTVKFIIPSSLPEIRIETANFENLHATRSVEDKGKERIITYVFRSIPALRHIPRAPSINVTAPRLMILGHYRNVDDLYGRLYSYVTMPDDPDPEAVKAIARSITSTCMTDSARIAAIYDYVHDNIRYKAIEHGEYGYVPDTPSEVLRKHFGDCKGSAGLLRAMLRAVDIDARYVWVGTEDIPTNWTDAPYIASGNHMIAAAVTGDSLLYLDGTAKHFRVGEIPTAIHGRQTIVEDSGEKCIIGMIPSGTPDDNYNHVTIRYSLTPDLMLTGDYSEYMTGEYNAAIRSIIEQISPDKRNDALISIVTNELKGTKVSNTEMIFDNGKTKLNAGLSVTGACQKIGEELYIDLNPYPHLQKLAFDTSAYNLSPRRIGIKSSREWTVSLEIPEGYIVCGLPSPLSFSNDWIDSSLETVLSPDETKIIRKLRFTVKKRDIPASGINQFNDDIKSITRYASELIPLKKSSHT